MFDKDRALHRFVRIANDIRSSGEGSTQRRDALVCLYGMTDYTQGLLQMEAEDKEADTPISSQG